MTADNHGVRPSEDGEAAAGLGADHPHRKCSGSSPLSPRVPTGKHPSDRGDGGSGQFRLGKHKDSQQYMANSIIYFELNLVKSIIKS